MGKKAYAVLVRSKDPEDLEEWQRQAVVLFFWKQAGRAPVRFFRTDNQLVGETYEDLGEEQGHKVLGLVVPYEEFGVPEPDKGRDGLIGLISFNDAPPHARERSFLVFAHDLPLLGIID